MRTRALYLALATALAALFAGILSGPATAGQPQRSTASEAATEAAPKVTSKAAFTHPGVLVSRAQLDFVRSKVNAGAQPWKGAYDAMLASPYASLSRTPKPRAVVECGPYSDPNIGCTDERQDALAAYSLSLAWYITRDSRYAEKAIQIMDAWSATIKDHTNSNAPLQTGWAGSSWPGRPRSSATATTAGPPPRSTASRPCCAPSTSRRSSAARTPTATGSW
ncbi:hypothetical protein SVIO_057820 [Streptomyces violaceusniger]|uniref:Alginate lyase domain-containing protein n=1 Tax=Streptomyces violaceusniger TaxID=68280 RepID=A0A4D4LAY8_STRVO|nr:hypothetical protein SVIO_057820 [Streptomyces violaceusniger]